MENVSTTQYLPGGGMPPEEICDSCANLHSKSAASPKGSAAATLLSWRCSETRQYYIALDGEEKGPYDGEALESLAAKGDLTRETFVWSEDMAEWTAASAVAELAALFPARKRASQPRAVANNNPDNSTVDDEDSEAVPAPGVTIPTSLKDVKDLYKQQLGNASQQIKSGFGFNVSAAKKAKSPSKQKPKVHRLLIVGIVLSIFTVFIDFEDLPVVDTLGIENSQIVMLSSALILIGGIGTFIRWLGRRKGK
jgi:hypothetical protein